MAATQDQRATATGLRLDSLRCFTLPVRNLDRSELFYTQVLGAKVVRRIENVEINRDLGVYPQLDLRWGDLDLSLVSQPYGEPTIIQSHPHHAFTTKGALVDTWQEHLTSWGIPSVIVCRQHGQKGIGDVCAIEQYFLDPDGNPLELDANDYVFSERVVWAPYDHFTLIYNGSTWWEKYKSHFKPQSGAAH